MSMDDRFTQNDGQQVFAGSELLVKGALETDGGVRLFTGTPGAPLAGYFDALAKIAPDLAKRDQVTRRALDGPSAVATVNGAQIAGCRTIATLSATALSQAVEPLGHGVLAGVRNDSGAVIVCGDDPWQDSVTLPTDSRYIAEQVRLPLLEPAEPQEVKDWVGLAFRLGQAGVSYVGLRLTVALAEGGGTVRCRPNQHPQLDQSGRRLLSYRRDIEPWVSPTLPWPESAHGEAESRSRLTALKAEAARLGLNRIVNRPQKGEVVPLGFVAAGMAYACLTQALAQMGLAGRLPILKLGLTYPVDEVIVTDMARQCRRLVVIEDRRDFVERQIAGILDPLKLAGEWLAELYGRRFPGGQAGGGIPDTGALHPSMLIERLAPLLRDHPTILPLSLSSRPKAPLAAELERIRRTADLDLHLPDRTPTFCAGCPHRDTASALLELQDDFADPQYMLAKHTREPVELICHGDGGCSSLLRHPPNKSLWHSYSGQGFGSATAAGAESFVQNRQLVFMGDGTFFQSGQSAIGQSIHLGQDVTYVILDNKTMAQSGRRCHAGTADDAGIPQATDAAPQDEAAITRRGRADKQRRPASGQAVFALDIERIVQGMISKQLRREARVVKINPADRRRYRNLLEQMVLADGVKIIIADKACGLTRRRTAQAQRRRAESEQGYVPRQTFANIDPQVCDDCRQCVRMAGCPGLALAQTSRGSTVQIDQSACINDKACQRINVCPAFEQVTVVRRRAPRREYDRIDTADLPDPPRPIHAEQETWRCFVAGVGGMGVGAAARILASAGNAMGYRIQFGQDKGSAVRTGRAYCQLVYTRSGHDNDNGLTTASVPYGTCDLLVGVDLLEAARGIDPAHGYRVAAPDRTAVTVNAVALPTVTNLMGLDTIDQGELDRTLRSRAHPDRYCSFDVSELSRRLFGSGLYANVMLLGMAYQNGFLPLHREALEQAIEHVLPDALRQNLEAFAVGRLIVADPRRLDFESPAGSETVWGVYRAGIAALSERFGSRRGGRIARRLRRLIRDTRREAGAFGRDPLLVADLIAAAHDCVIWGGLDYARRYCSRIARVASLDHSARGFELAQTVVRNLARVMLIKDEVYVSTLLTSDQKRRRDLARFNIDLDAQDQIIYRRVHRPEFSLLRRRFSFEWTSRDWQLRLMSRVGWLRRLMPRWHQREQRFRDWYERLVDQVDLSPDSTPEQYERWLAALGTPEMVSGFREVAYPKMAAAQRRADQLLAVERVEATRAESPRSAVQSLDS